jgi:mono/diheme cytochrome c family protein
MSMPMTIHRVFRSAALGAALLGLAAAAHAAAAGAPKLYTEAQAEKGAAVYAQDCAGCHGADLQGASGPAVAGTAFLNKTKTLEWSVENFRHVVTSTMPRSNPGSLSDEQYADVIAYLLAADCFPPGNTPLPDKATPQLKAAKMQAPAGVQPDDKAHGTCKPHHKA